MNAEPGGAAVEGRDTNHETAARFFDLTGDMLAVITDTGSVVTVNAAFGRMVGRPATQCVGASITDIIVPTDPAEFARRNDSLSTALPRIDFEFDASIGGRAVTLSASLDLDGASGHRYFVAQDVSEQRRLRAQLAGRDHKDELSGLGNRHAFNDALSLEMKMSDSVAVIHVLVDGVDALIGEHGEPVVDELLQAAVSRMRRNLRDTDLMSRFSRGEFAILLSGRNVAGSAERLGAQLAESLRRSFGVKGARIDVTSAIGVAVGSSDTHDPAQLIAEAGRATQEAKQTGSTRAVVFGREGLSAIATAGRAGDDLRTALADPNSYELEVQGIFAAAGRGAMGVETLLTKRASPMRRLADTNDTREVIEATTLDAALSVFDAIGGWLAAHSSRRACFNIAAHQLPSAELFAAIAAAAKSHHLNPSQIVCEVSETILGDSASSPERMTQEIHRNGFTLAIDHFGTETASLGSLRTIDVTYVKLSPVLTSSLFTSEFHSAVVRSTIAVARTMGVSVIAAGVADTQQLEAIRELGCDFVQGRGVHRPEALTSFAAHLG